MFFLSEESAEDFAGCYYCITLFLEVKPPILIMLIPFISLERKGEKLFKNSLENKLSTVSHNGKHSKIFENENDIFYLSIIYHLSIIYLLSIYLFIHPPAKFLN